MGGVILVKKLYKHVLPMESQSDLSHYIVNSGKPVWSNEFQAAYTLVCMTAHSRSLCQYSEASIFLWCGTSQGISHLWDQAEDHCIQSPTQGHPCLLLLSGRIYWKCLWDIVVPKNQFFAPETIGLHVLGKWLNTIEEFKKCSEKA